MAEPVGRELVPAEFSAADLAPHPDDFGDALRSRLAAIDSASDSHAEDLRPHNTARGYASDWRTWQQFTAHAGIPVTAAGRGTLRGFVTWLWEEQRLAYATVDRKLSGVVVTLRREHQVPVTPEDTKAARRTLRDLQRRAAERGEVPRGRGKAPAMRIDALRAIVAACPDTLAGLRDRTTVLLGFAIAGRRHEVAALLVRDLVLEEGRGLVVDVRVSKTHPRVVAVPYGERKETCPVRTWLAWKDAAGLHDPGSPALRRMHRLGGVTRAGLSPQSVGTVITTAGQRAGVPIRFTGHSVRSGMLTEGRRAGKDRRALQAISGHADGSKVLDGYLQIADRWNDQDNGLAGIGL
ncbi:tyrosine-type recombinase/integrase [Streptomyces sp. NPDC001380]|uniref:tyrosine-type recombinase/integrase n=1 Tax=Streptomyces sp. NPDC001380 TaxID=3364566 RepID=UPI00369858D1